MINTSLAISITILNISRLNTPGRSLNVSYRVEKILIIFKGDTL